MHPLLKDIRHNPLLWLLVFVPVVFAAHKFTAEAPTLLFTLSVLAIVPLAALLSHATESVAAKTGDTVGGLLNTTLGNLTELVIALAALRVGQYALVKASVAGAIAPTPCLCWEPHFFSGVSNGAGGRRGGNGFGVCRGAEEPAGFERGHRARERGANCALRRASACACKAAWAVRRVYVKLVRNVGSCCACASAS
jgi:hypothetical protein